MTQREFWAISTTKDVNALFDALQKDIKNHVVLCKIEIERDVLGHVKRSVTHVKTSDELRKVRQLLDEKEVRCEVKGRHNNTEVIIQPPFKLGTSDRFSMKAIFDCKEKHDLAKLFCKDI